MKTPVNRVLRGLAIALAAIVILVMVAAAALYLAVRGSLPKLDGDENLSALSAPVSATRDAIGMVTITANQLADAYRALGYLHAQERFFEMVLTRRSAAGELSALLGAATVAVDRDKRRHRLRARMALQWQALSKDEQNHLTQYTEGVNTGLSALTVRPWQYLILRAAPEPWTPLDSMLVVCEMYSMLQGRDAENRFNDALLRSQIGDALFDWLKPKGGSWDAPLDGSIIAPAATPSIAQLNTSSTHSS